MAKVQQFIFAADMAPDMGEYCYHLLDYFLMSSERLLRVYNQGNNKDEICSAMNNVNLAYDRFIALIADYN